MLYIAGDGMLHCIYIGNGGLAYNLALVVSKDVVMFRSYRGGIIALYDGMRIYLYNMEGAGIPPDNTVVLDDYAISQHNVIPGFTVSKIEIHEDIYNKANYNVILLSDDGRLYDTKNAKLYDFSNEGLKVTSIALTSFSTKLMVSLSNGNLYLLDCHLNSTGFSKRLLCNTCSTNAIIVRNSGLIFYEKYKITTVAVNNAKLIKYSKTTRRIADALVYKRRNTSILAILFFDGTLEINRDISFSSYSQQLNFDSITEMGTLTGNGQFLYFISACGNLYYLDDKGSPTLIIRNLLATENTRIHDTSAIKLYPL